MVFTRSTETSHPGGRRNIPVTWTTTWLTRRRPAASSTALWLRGQPGAVEKVARDCRRAECSRSPPASSCSGNATAWRSALRPTGTSWAGSTPACPTQRRAAALHRRLVSVDGKRVASGRDFDSLGVVRKPDEGRRARRGLGRLAGYRLAGGQPVGGVRRGEALYPAAVSAVHDLHVAAGGRATSCASPPTGR